MPEIPSGSPERPKDAAALLEAIVLAAEARNSPEAKAARDEAALRDLLPGLPASDLTSVLGSLRDTGTLDRLLALTSDPEK